MAYKSTVRKPPFEVTEAHNYEPQEAWMDECLKEGTDQGWRLHSAIPFTATSLSGRRMTNAER